MLNKKATIVLVGPLLRNLIGFRGELVERLKAEGYNVILISQDASNDNPLMPENTTGYNVEVVSNWN